MSTPLLKPVCKAEDPEESSETYLAWDWEWGDDLQVGDLLFMDYTNFNYWTFLGNYNDHVAICVNNTPGNETFIQAVSGGVEYINATNGSWMKSTNFLLARLKKPLEEDKMKDLVNWTMKRIGEPYQHWSPFNLTTGTKNETCDGDNNSIGWYCSELAWAAYYNIQIQPRIDIDNNGWDLPPYGVPAVNMGLHIGWLGIFFNISDWIKDNTPLYIFKNEILIDDDINITWKQNASSGFSAGSQVQLYNGSIVNIEDVQVGDIVASYDMRLEQIVPARVTRVICYDSGELTDNLITINNNFQLTANHSLFVNNWWVSAGDVEVGYELLSYSNGEPEMITVDSIERGNHPLANCYALELDSSLGALASYFVNGILVCV